MSFDDLYAAYSWGMREPKQKKQFWQTERGFDSGFLWRNGQGSPWQKRNRHDNPNIDPHDFEATTKTAKQTANADVIIRNGAGYDDWIKKLSDKKSISAARLMNVKDGQNEHLWYNPETMSRLADELVNVFSKKMPSKKAEFKQNAAAYKKKVARLNSELEKIRAERIEKPVAVSEPVFDYSLEKMGYKVADAHFAKAVEEESDPSYTDIKNLQNKIKRKGRNPCFFAFSPMIPNEIWF